MSARRKKTIHGACFEFLKYGRLIGFLSKGKTKSYVSHHLPNLLLLTGNGHKDLYFYNLDTSFSVS